MDVSLYLMQTSMQKNLAYKKEVLAQGYCRRASGNHSSQASGQNVHLLDVISCGGMTRVLIID